MKWNSKQKKESASVRINKSRQMRFDVQNGVSYQYGHEPSRKPLPAFIKNELPMLKVPESSATYLLWLDCREVYDDSRAFCRMNVACPEERLVGGLMRLRAGVAKIV